MAALLGPWWAPFALTALASSCATYGPELVAGAVPQGGSAGEGGATAGATAGTGQQQAGTAGDAASGASGSSNGGSDGVPMDPYLRGDSDPPPITVVLSSEGHSDWVHWGLKSPVDRNQKTGVTSQLLDFKPQGSEQPGAYMGGPIAFSWNDGTPTVAATTHNGIAWEGAGQGFELSIPAVFEERIARVYVGVRAGTALFNAQLSEADALPFEETFESEGAGWTLQMFTLDYGWVKTADATMTIGLSLETATAADGAVQLGAITIDVK